MKKNLPAFLPGILAAGLIISFLSLFSPESAAFSGCEEGCQKCHTISNEEVNLLLKKLKVQDAKVVSTQMSPVKGLWEILIDEKGKHSLIYVDFSKKYLVAGSIIEVNAALNKTKERLDELKRIDPASVPLKNSLILGSNTAKAKVVVFTDPD